MSSLNDTIETPLTKLLGIKYPVILAGMNKAAGPKLAAAVTNAGGLGVIGGVGFTPRILKMTINNLKKDLKDKDAPFGVDLLIPKVGSGARKTNYDYTYGKLDQLIDIIIESKPKLFVCAVGVPPKRVVDKLHKANIFVMNMIGHPKHVAKACAAGVDIICAQGGEGGGHTGTIPTSILLPKCADLCQNYTSPLTGKPVALVGAGGIYDGRGLVMALGFGCQAVWVGTRFVCATEAGASNHHKHSILGATVDDTYRTLVYTGRPLRVVKNDYATDWETNRQDEMKDLLNKGIIPYKNDVKTGKVEDTGRIGNAELAGIVSGNIENIVPAKTIVESMVREAVAILKEHQAMIKSKL